MGKFKFQELELAGAYRIKNFSASDRRGEFTKCFEREIYAASGIEFQLNESFVSISAKNVIRGLHFQTHYPQAKIVCVPKGRVWDVIVDLRPDRPTYQKWVGVELSADNYAALYIPRGFAHGFVSLEDETMMFYQCDGAYDRKTDTGIRFDDPDIGIKWPVDLKNVIYSDRDGSLMSFREYQKRPMELCR